MPRVGYWRWKLAVVHANDISCHSEEIREWTVSQHVVDEIFIVCSDSTLQRLQQIPHEFVRTFVMDWIGCNCEFLFTPAACIIGT